MNKKKNDFVSTIIKKNYLENNHNTHTDIQVNCIVVFKQEQ